MTLRSFDPNDVLLRAGNMPKELMFLVSGKIQILQKEDDLIEPEPNSFKVRTVNGARKKMSVLDGTYGEVYLDKVITDNDTYEMLGAECDMNGIASPYTYVAKEQTYAFCSPAVNLYKDILR